MSCRTAKVVVHFGWPMSSWLDRLAVGVMVFNLMRLPRMFPQFEFDMHYFRRPQEHPKPPPGTGGNRGRARRGEAHHLDLHQRLSLDPAAHPFLASGFEVDGKCTATLIR